MLKAIQGLTPRGGYGWWCVYHQRAFLTPHVRRVLLMVDPTKATPACPVCIEQDMVAGAIRVVHAERVLKNEKVALVQIGPPEGVIDAPRERCAACNLDAVHQCIKCGMPYCARHFGVAGVSRMCLICEGNLLGREW